MASPAFTAYYDGDGRRTVKVAAGTTNCFVAGTPVQMADGSFKKIEDVREGDLVLSRNPDTGVTEAKAVLAHSVRIAPQVLMLTLVDSVTHLTQSITCTPGHPFYVQGQGFVLPWEYTASVEIRRSRRPPWRRSIHTDDDYYHAEEREEFIIRDREPIVDTFMSGKPSRANWGFDHALGNPSMQNLDDGSRCAGTVVACVKLP